MGKMILGLVLLLVGIIAGGAIVLSVQVASAQSNESQALNVVSRALNNHSALGDDIGELWDLIGREENEGYVGDLVAGILDAHQAIGNDLAEIQREVEEYELVADAGPDQNVSGSNIVTVEFDGSGSSHNKSTAHGVGINTYQWYNQWGALRAEGFRPTFDVNFGKNPQPGTTRSFRLVATDTVGITAEDWVTITLAEDPSHRFMGTVSVNGKSLPRDRPRSINAMMRHIDVDPEQKVWQSPDGRVSVGIAPVNKDGTYQLLVEVPPEAPQGQIPADGSPIYFFIAQHGEDDPLESLQMEQIGSWKQCGQTVLDLNTMTTERDEYSRDISVVYDRRGDYSFSYYQLGELSDDGYLTEIEGGIIDLADKITPTLWSRATTRKVPA